MKRSEFRRLYTLYNTIFIKLKEKHNILYKNMYEYILAYVYMYILKDYTCIRIYAHTLKEMKIWKSD